MNIYFAVIERLSVTKTSWKSKIWRNKGENNSISPASDTVNNGDDDDNDDDGDDDYHINDDDISAQWIDLKPHCKQHLYNI